MQALRVAIIGARKRHQGIGQYIARDFAALGAEVVAIAGTSPNTAHEAKQQLHVAYNLEVNAYHQIEEMLSVENLDALAICSPFRFHKEQLELALAANLHVLCEKPFIFELDEDRSDAIPSDDVSSNAIPSDDVSSDTVNNNPANNKTTTEVISEILSKFAQRKKVVMVNEQWPYTLSYFDQLYPEQEIFQQPPQSLEMTLCPNSTGVKMLADAMPHVISMLLAMVDANGIANNIVIQPAALSTASDERQAFTSLPNHSLPEQSLEVSFDYQHAKGSTHVSTWLHQVPEQPRPARYAINGCRVNRAITLPGYTFSLETMPDTMSRQSNISNQSGEPIRSIAIDDPLKLLLQDFITRVQTEDNVSSNHQHILTNSIILNQLCEVGRSLSL